LSSPQTVSLDGDDWTVYPLPPGAWSEQRIWEQPPVEAAQRTSIRVPGLISSVANSFPWIDDPEAHDWVFERIFVAPSEIAGGVARLRFEGIDDAAHVFLNGQHVGDHVGQFAPADWNVTERINPGAENHLQVVVERAPELDVPPGALSRQRRWKSRFAYGWPGFQRTVSVGIWQSVSLLVTGPAWIRTAAIYSNISLDRSEAALSIVCEFSAVRQTRTILRTEITHEVLPSGSVEDQVRVFEDTGVVQSTTLPRVQLWWPNGHGRQPVYRARFSLLNLDGQLLDQREMTFGVRHIEALPCDGAPPDSLPYALAVNGRRIWLKGWDWLPLRADYAGLTDADYEPLLRRAKDAGANLLRVWGGGLLETGAFYRVCDRLGLMVWQEFPLVALGDDAQPPSDPGYLDAIREQAEAMVALRRNHPALVRWSGGSGLHAGPPDRVPLGSEHPALAELRAVIETEDPQRSWVPVTPEGPALPADGGREAPLFHAGFGAHSEGQHEDPRAGELLDTQALQYALEADRRRQNSCAGTSPWSLNETSPTPTGPAAVSYEGVPRPAFYAVQRAYRPFHVSARLPSLVGSEGATFQADIWLHNDGPERSLLNVVATIVDLHGRELYQENLAAEAPAGASDNVGDLYWRYPSGFASAFVLFLEVIDEEGDTLAINHYHFSRASAPAFAPYLNAPPTTLAACLTGGALEIENTGTAVAVCVTINAGPAASLSDNAFPLAPGAKRSVPLRNPAAIVTLSAWNAPEHQCSSATTP